MRFTKECPCGEEALEYKDGFEFGRKCHHQEISDQVSAMGAMELLDHQRALWHFCEKEVPK